MIKFIMAGIVALSLAACAGKSVQTTEIGCITATGAEFSVATYNTARPLPAKDQANILLAVAQVDAVCKAPTPASDTQLQSLAFQEAAALLVTEAAKLGAK